MIKFLIIIIFIQLGAAASSFNQSINGLTLLFPVINGNCPTEITQSNNVQLTWSYKNTSEGQTSKPLCLDEFRQPVYRYCYYNSWSSEPDCEYIQKNKISYSKCPKDYVELMNTQNQSLCILVAKTESWDYQCLKSASNTHLFEVDKEWQQIILDYLSSNDVSEFWIPAKRVNTFSPVLWYLSHLWKTRLNITAIGTRLTANNNDDDEHCLSFKHKKRSNDQFGEPSIFLNPEFKDCEDDLPMLCLYRPTSTMLIRLGCPLNSYTSKYSSYQDRCFFIEQNSTTCSYGQLYNAGDYDKSNLYTELASRLTTYQNEKCFVAINWWEKTDHHFANWNEDDLGFGDHTVINTDGRWSFATNSTCSVCEAKQKSVLKPELRLKFSNLVTFQLKIRSRHLLYYTEDKNEEEPQIFEQVHCFVQRVNNEIEKLDKIFYRDYSNVKKNIYSSSSLVEDDIFIKEEECYINTYTDGLYWCEAHSIFNFELITTEKLRRQKPNSFLGIATIKSDKFKNEWLYHYDATYLDFIAERFRQFFYKYNFYSSAITVVNLESYDEDDQELTFLYSIVEYEELLVVNDFYMTQDNIMDVTSKYNIMWNLMKRNEEKDLKFHSLNHSSYCLPYYDYNDSCLWPGANIYETVVLSDECLDTGDFLRVQQCVGNTVYGVTWQNYGGKITRNKNSEVTKFLKDMEKVSSNNTETTFKLIQNMSEIINKNSEMLSSYDVYTMSKIMINSKNVELNNNYEMDTSDKIFSLTNMMSNLMTINKTVIVESQNMNTTNNLLDSYDFMLNKISQSVLSKRESETDVVVVYTPKLIVNIIDPSVRNLSGIALYRNLSKSDNEIHGDFRDCYIKHLFADMEHKFKGFDEGIMLASYIPYKLVNKLIESAIPNLRIVITLQYNDVLFQECTKKVVPKSDSAIISISIPGYNNNLPDSIPFYFRPNANELNGNITNACGYWEFHPKDQSLKGEWSRDGCYYLGETYTKKNNQSISICSCTHLTHFALLVQGTQYIEVQVQNDVIVTEVHEEVLDIITILGCSLSLVGIFGILLTAIAFPTWRRTNGILLQFSTAIALQMILMFCLSSELVTHTILSSAKQTKCILFGALLHYSVLTVFSWMLITAYLQFKRYVTVFGSKPTHLMLKTVIIGWILPLIPVLLAVFLSSDSYIPPSLASSTTSICYPTSYTLYFSVLLPITIIIIANLIIFIFVTYSIFKGSKVRATEKDMLLSQLRLSIFLFFTLGLSWIFGLASASKLGIVFSYLFCLTATIQGFILFIYFVIMNPNTRNLWVQCFKCGDEKKI